MKVLLDTHAFLWWVFGDGRLSATAKAAVGTPGCAVYVSAATAWEITTKHRLGKLPGAAVVAADVRKQVAGERFLELPVTMEHAQHAGSLAGTHKDPFDRMLVAQAIVEALPLISNERLFDGFGITRIW